MSAMESLLYAIDPGPTESALVVYDLHREQIKRWEKSPNVQISMELQYARFHGRPKLAVEMIASYGMPVGAETFETCVWVGRFLERWEANVRTEPLLVFRKDVKLHLCQTLRATDANVRASLIDLFGPGKDSAVGRKANPGPLYGLKGDGWSALAVAVTAAAQLDAERKVAA